MVDPCPVCGRTPEEYTLITEKGPMYCLECMDSFSIREKTSWNEAKRKWNEGIKILKRRAMYERAEKRTV